MDRFARGAALVGALVFLTIFGIALCAGFGWLAVLLFFTVGAAYAWMLFAFLHYRRCRQEELLQVIATAVAAEAPLVPALAAYLEDRPQGLLHEFWVALLL